MNLTVINQSDRRLRHTFPPLAKLCSVTSSNDQPSKRFVPPPFCANSQAIRATLLHHCRSSNQPTNNISPLPLQPRAAPTALTPAPLKLKSQSRNGSVKLIH